MKVTRVSVFHLANYHDLPLTLFLYIESCYCNYGGRCICACRKEQPQLNATPEFDCDEDSNYLTKPESCLVDGLSFDTMFSYSFLALGEKGHHNPAPETANAPEQDGAYE